jgi:ATP-dependent Clp protease ATP-binding subunit ClpA
MFERFTKEARDVVERAGDEAVAAGAAVIDREHLLLGVVAVDPGRLGLVGLRDDVLRAELAASGGALDADALATIGIDLDAVRRTVEAEFGEGALERGRIRRGHIPFTPQAKKTLEVSLRSAIALEHKHIGSGHLLLGVLRTEGEDNLALVVLADADVDPEDVCATATRLLQSEAA